MDTVKFVKEYLRLCSQPWDCEDCPLNKTDFCSVPPKERSQEKAEEVVRLVEEWAAAHPRKTRQSVFLEQYPNARIDSHNTLYICPADIYGDAVCPANRKNPCILCCDCRREFWVLEQEG